MMDDEKGFVVALVANLGLVISDCHISTKMSLLYAISFNEKGQLNLGLDKDKKPIRGGGTGFEQDILLFNEVPIGDASTKTTIIPRVICEVKYRQVTTHDVLVYSEKARRIRTIYPFVRYGLILGNMGNIPQRVLRLGQEFDFIAVVKDPTPLEDIDALRSLLQEEIESSLNLGQMLSSGKPVTALRRELKLTFVGK